MLAEVVVETLGDVAGHLQVLDLVLAHGHDVGVEHQDVGGHEDGVGVEAHGDAFVRVLAAVVLVLLDRGLVGVGPVHEALGRHAGQDPGQLRDLRDVGLAVEGALVRVQAQGQPGGGHFEPGLVDALGLLAFDQGVEVGQEVVGVDVLVAAGLDARADGPDVIAQVWRAGGGDSGQDGHFLHR